MKKIITVLMAIIMILSIEESALAKDNTSLIMSVSYSALENATEKILSEDADEVILFCDLDEDVKDYLEDNNIDSNNVGEVLYKNIDGVPTMIALYYIDDGTLVLSTLTGYARDAKGEYIKTAAPGYTTRSWVSGSVSDTYPYTELTVTASIYISYYYVSALELYYRPFQLVFWYNNNSGYSPTVTNFYAQGVMRGKKYTYSGSTFTPAGTFIDWSVSRTVTSPTAGIHYTETQYMSDGVCMIEPYSGYTKGSLYINGTRQTFTINYFWM